MPGICPALKTGVEELKLLKRIRKDRINYLDYIPMRNPKTEFRTDCEEKVILTKEWTGFYNRIAQRFFRKPRFSYIELDGYGSFVWNKIDGYRDVLQISSEFEREYPDEEKSLSRVVRFIEILRDNGFIYLKQQNA